jgi:hypothetical protein
MPRYRFYRFGSDGRCQRYDDYTCADDEDALSRAEGLNAQHAIEVWLGNRPVGRIEPNRMALRHSPRS